jgi:MFS family permease
MNPSDNDDANPDANVGRGAARPSLGASDAWRFIVLLGVVSLLADMTYEGARSVTGPFLASLGATGAAVGFAAGFGELIGYTIRLVSGVASDRTGRYWTLTIVGYAVNLLAVPLMALAGRWEVVAGLVVAERLGKAIRSPARDAMLAHATANTGHGRGFGLHEALDQIGAMTGPLIIAGALAWGAGYRGALGLLIVPALAALGVLLAANRRFPNPHDLAPVAPHIEPKGLDRRFWLYLLAASCVAAGFADFPLIAFHAGRTNLVSPPWVPVLYAAAMGVDALAALAFGRWFDRRGLVVLIPATLISAGFAPLAFLGGPTGLVVGILLWGIGLGAQESILRAAVATLVPSHRRGTAYGLFNAGFGLAWFAGSVTMGLLYDRSPAALAAFSVIAHLLAIPVLVAVSRRRG